MTRHECRGLSRNTLVSISRHNIHTVAQRSETDISAAFMAVIIAHRNITGEDTHEAGASFFTPKATSQ